LTFNFVILQIIWRSAFPVTTNFLTFLKPQKVEILQMGHMVTEMPVVIFDQNGIKIMYVKTIFEMV